MLIQKIGVYNQFRSKVNNRTNNKHNNSNVSFGISYTEARMLYGTGYGRTNFMSEEEFNRCGGSRLFEDHSGLPDPDEGSKRYYTRKVEELLEKGKNVEAIEMKLDIAKICKKQGKERDAFMLEEGIRKLYANLSASDKSYARYLISQYNSDMAAYIDSDIRRLS